MGQRGDVPEKPVRESLRDDGESDERDDGGVRLMMSSSSGAMEE